MERLAWFRVIPQLGRLTPTSNPDLPSSINTADIQGRIHRVRVETVVYGRRKNKTEVKLFFGIIAELPWDPGRYRWKDEKHNPLLAYSTKLGRELLSSKHIIPNVVDRKWQGILPTSYKLQWLRVWNNTRTKKEVGLMWLIWHRAVCVNEWRRSSNNRAVIDCLVCTRGSVESILHRFWE